MNKNSKTLTRQKHIEQIRIMLRTKEGINKEVYMPIMNCDCYFISTDKLALAHSNRKVL